VQEESRHQESETDHTQEWQTGYGGCLPQLWDESIQDRKSLGIHQPLVVERQGIGPALLVSVESRRVGVELVTVVGTAAEKSKRGDGFARLQ